MVENKKCSLYKNIAALIFAVVIIACTSNSYADTSAAVEINEINSFSKINKKAKATITDYRNNQFELTFVLQKKDGIPNRTEFDITDSENKNHVGEISKSNEICNTFRVNEPKDYYRCYVTGWFEKQSDASYRTFSFKIFDENNKLIKTIENRMPELEVGLGKSIQDGKILELKNVYSEPITIINVEGGGYVDIDMKNAPKITISPNEKYEINLRINKQAQDYAKNEKFFKDVLRIEYTVGGESLISEIGIGLGATCPSGKQCSCDSEKQDIRVSAEEAVPPLTPNPGDQFTKEASVYTENKVQILDSTSMVSSQADAKIKMVDMGVHKLEFGQYQISLLLKNTDPKQGYVTLESGYTAKLIDAEGKEHNVKVDEDQINYSGECREGILSDKECLITIVGDVDENINYKSCEVTIRYRNDETNENIIQAFKEDIRDITVKYSLEMLSPTSGTYTLHIQNSSENSITIETVSLKSKCISLNDSIKRIKLGSDQDYKIEFQIGAYTPQNDGCDEHVSITYTVYDDNTKLKTVLVPIKIVAGAKSNVLFNIGITLVTVVIVPIAAYLIASAYTNSACPYMVNGFTYYPPSAYGMKDGYPYNKFTEHYLGSYELVSAFESYYRNLN